MPSMMGQTAHPDSMRLASYFHHSGTRNQHRPSFWHLYRYGVRQPVFGGLNRLSDGVGLAPMLGPRHPVYNQQHYRSTGLKEDLPGPSIQGQTVEGEGCDTTFDPSITELKQPISPATTCCFTLGGTRHTLPHLNPDEAVRYDKFVGYRWEPKDTAAKPDVPAAPDRLYKNQANNQQIAKFQKKTTVPSLQPCDKLGRVVDISEPGKPHNASQRRVRIQGRLSRSQSLKETSSGSKTAPIRLQAAEVYRKATDAQAMAWVIEGVSRERIEAVKEANRLKLPTFERSNTTVTNSIPRSVTRERGRYRPISRVSVRQNESRQRLSGGTPLELDPEMMKIPRPNSRSVYAYNQMLLRKHESENTASAHLTGKERAPGKLLPTREGISISDSSPAPPPGSHHGEDDDYNESEGSKGNVVATGRTSGRSDLQPDSLPAV